MGLVWKTSREDSHRYVVKVPGNGRTWWALLLAGGFGLLLGILLVGEKSLFTAWRLQRERLELAARIQETRLENQKLAQQIQDLQRDPKSVEMIAREELGMVRPDEIVYRFIPGDRSNAGQKTGAPEEQP